MFDMWEPPKPTLILSPERPAIIRPAQPGDRLPPALGLTMMARTWGLRSNRREVASAGISLVGVFENSSNGASTTTVTISGAASGDVAYAFQCFADVGASAAPSGYSTLGFLEIVEGVFYFGVFRKVLSGADASCVFPANDDGGNSGSACGVVLLRGVSNSTPEDATMTTTQNQTSGQPDGPAITTVTNNAWVISAFGAFVNADGTFTEPSTYGNKIDLVGSGTNADGGLGVAMIDAGAAGSKNPGAWSGVTFDDNNWAAATIAVRPA